MSAALLSPRTIYFESLLTKAKPAAQFQSWATLGEIPPLDLGASAQQERVLESEEKEGLEAELNQVRHDMEDLLKPGETGSYRATKEHTSPVLKASKEAKDVHEWLQVMQIWSDDKEGQAAAPSQNIWQSLPQQDSQRRSMLGATFKKQRTDATRRLWDERLDYVRSWKMGMGMGSISSNSS